MRNKLQLALALILAFTLAGAGAEAKVITFDFEGEVVGEPDVGCSDRHPWTADSILSGKITFDTAMAGVVVAEGMSYQFGPSTTQRIHGSMDSSNFNFDTGFEIVVTDENSTGADTLRIMADEPVGAHNGYLLDIVLEDAQGSALSSDDLPVATIDLAQFADAPNDVNEVDFSITEPASSCTYSALLVLTKLRRRGIQDQWVLLALAGGLISIVIGGAIGFTVVRSQARRAT